jgi:hypothetical protein
LTSSKGSLHAHIQGRIRFRSEMAPGWDQRGNFLDPRPQQRGALPAGWGHYRGLYRNGAATIFAYDVGGVARPMHRSLPRVEA